MSQAKLTFIPLFLKKNETSVYMNDTWKHREEQKRNIIADNILSQTSIIIRNKEARTL